MLCPLGLLRPPPSAIQQSPRILPLRVICDISPRPQSCSFCPDHPETRRLETPTHPHAARRLALSRTTFLRSALRCHLVGCGVLAARPGTSGPISPLTHLFSHAPSAATHKPTWPPKAHLQPGTLTQFLHTLGHRCLFVQFATRRCTGSASDNTTKSPADQSRHKESALKLQYLLPHVQVHRTSDSTLPLDQDWWHTDDGIPSLKTRANIDGDVGRHVQLIAGGCPSKWRW